MSGPALPTFGRSLIHATIALLGATALGIAACSGGGGGGGTGAIGDDPPSSTGQATLLGATLDAPWGLAFLPDDRMLVTEKNAARIALVSSDGNSVQARLSGPSGVNSSGQGGLLDVALDSAFASSRWVYLTFAESGAGGSGTALARGKLNAAYNGWEEAPQTIWRQTPKVDGTIHYGARIAWRNDGTFYVATGERGLESNDGSARGDGVQNVNNTIGKVVRLNRDGTPADGGLGVWSIGHRNPQGAAVRPGSNELWLTEHGPQGGDELNRIEQNGNYGWPVKSYGCAYGAPVGDACRIGGGAHSGFTEPSTYWVPTSTAPSGLAFYDGKAFPQWRGSVFAGALAGQTLWRMTVDGGATTSRQEVAAVKALGARIRDVRQGPDGNLYLLTDGQGNNANRIVRLAP